MIHLAGSLQIMYTIGNWFVFIGAIVYWTFCIIYAYLANWWKHESGAHLFSFSLAMAIILTYVSWRIIWPARTVEAVDIYARTAIFAVEAGLATWRLSILIRSQYRAYKAEKARYAAELEAKRRARSTDRSN